MFFAISLFGQDNLYYLNNVDTIRINFSNRYFLSSTNIVPFSDSLILRGKTLKHSEYNLSFIESGFSLSDSLEYSIFDTLFVYYKSDRKSVV